MRRSQLLHRVLLGAAGISGACLLFVGPHIAEAQSTGYCCVEFGSDCEGGYDTTSCEESGEGIISAEKSVCDCNCGGPGCNKDLYFCTNRQQVLADPPAPAQCSVPSNPSARPEGERGFPTQTMCTQVCEFSSCEDCTACRGLGANCPQSVCELNTKCSWGQYFIFNDDGTTDTGVGCIANESMCLTSSRSSAGANRSVPSTCGNGIRNPGEECDGSDLGGVTCQSLGYPSPATPTCTSRCELDVSMCTSTASASSRAQSSASSYTSHSSYSSRSSSSSSSEKYWISCCKVETMTVMIAAIDDRAEAQAVVSCMNELGSISQAHTSEPTETEVLMGCKSPGSSSASSIPRPPFARDPPSSNSSVPATGGGQASSRQPGHMCESGMGTPNICTPGDDFDSDTTWFTASIPRDACEQLYCPLSKTKVSCCVPLWGCEVLTASTPTNPAPGQCEFAEGMSFPLTQEGTENCRAWLEASGGTC